MPLLIRGQHCSATVASSFTLHISANILRSVAKFHRRGREQWATYVLSEAENTEQIFWWQRNIEVLLHIQWGTLCSQLPSFKRGQWLGKSCTNKPAGFFLSGALIRSGVVETVYGKFITFYEIEFHIKSPLSFGIAQFLSEMTIECKRTEFDPGLLGKLSHYNKTVWLSLKILFNFNTSV